MGTKIEQREQLRDQDVGRFSPESKARPAQFAEGTQRDVRVQSTKGLRIATRCETLDQFVATFHRYCEDAAIFIPRRCRSVGAVTAFSFDLVDGQSVLSGLGTVVEDFTTASNRFGRPGNLIALQKLGRGSSRVFASVLAAGKAARANVAAEGTPVPVFSRTQTAPIALDARVDGTAPIVEPPAVEPLQPGQPKDHRASTAIGFAAIGKMPGTLAIKVPEIVAAPSRKPEPLPARLAPKRTPVAVPVILPLHRTAPSSAPRPPSTSAPVIAKNVAAPTVVANDAPAPRAVAPSVTAPMPSAMTAPMASAKTAATPRAVTPRVTAPMVAAKDAAAPRTGTPDIVAKNIAANVKATELTARDGRSVRRTGTKLGLPTVLPVAPAGDAVPEPTAELAYDTVREALPLALRQAPGDAVPEMDAGASADAASVPQLDASEGSIAAVTWDSPSAAVTVNAAQLEEPGVLPVAPPVTAHVASASAPVGPTIEAIVAAAPVVAKPVAAWANSAPTLIGLAPVSPRRTDELATSTTHARAPLHTLAPHVQLELIAASSAAAAARPARHSRWFAALGAFVVLFAVSIVATVVTLEARQSSPQQLASVEPTRDHGPQATTDPSSRDSLPTATAPSAAADVERGPVEVPGVEAAPTLAAPVEVPAVEAAPTLAAPVEVAAVEAAPTLAAPVEIAPTAGPSVPMVTRAVTPSPATPKITRTAKSVPKKTAPARRKVQRKKPVACSSLDCL